MYFNDTSAVMGPADGPPPWLAKLAPDATLEASVLKQPIQGRDAILALIKQAIPLYESQTFTYKAPFGDDFFMESYRATILGGTPIECLVLVHYNAKGEADSLVINHRPLQAALRFSALMWERVGDQFGDLYLTGPQAAALASAGLQP
jgi:hypothetical protein